MTTMHRFDTGTRCSICICHAKLCHDRASRVYFKTGKNAHGATSVYRYQRCEHHPVHGADRVEGFAPTCAHAQVAP